MKVGTIHTELNRNSPGRSRQRPGQHFANQWPDDRRDFEQA